MTYKPGKDSMMMAEYLEDNPIEAESCLDMGTGSGILAKKMREKAETVHAVDKDPEAVKYARERLDDIKVYRSDLFSEVERKFDLIAFNPPYLPGEDESDHSDWAGGKNGIELTERFLNNADSYLNKRGRILFLVSDRADSDQLIQENRVLDTTHDWFEKLYLLEKN